MTKTIRASAVPGIMQCNASKFPAKVPIRTDEKPAHIGSAIHAVLSSDVDGSHEWDIERACDNWPDVEPKDLRILYYIGRKLWDTYEPLLDVLEIETEHKVMIPDTDYELTGHMDIAGWYANEPDTLVVIDWKSGRVEGDYSDQLLAYAYLLSWKYPEAQSFKIVTAWLRDNRAPVKDVSLAVLADFEKRLIEAASSSEYHPGEVCVNCNLRYECEAQTSLTRTSVEGMLAIGQKEGQEITPALVMSTYPRFKMVEKICKDFDKAVRNLVETNGPMSIGDGRVLGFKEEERKTIALNLDVLQQHLSMDTINEIVTVGKTKLMTAVKDIAPPRQGAAMCKVVMEQLEEAGAVTTKTIRKLVAKRRSTCGQKEI